MNKDILEVGYKAGKIAAMLFIGGGFILSLRDKIEAVPVLQKEVSILKVESQNQKEMLIYIVGGMEQMTGRKYKPRRVRFEGE